MPLRDLFFLAIILGLIPLILSRPWTGVMAWYWVGLMNPHRISWGFLRDMPVAMMIGAATLIALVYAKGKRAPPLTREMVVMILFVLHFTVVTFFFSWTPDNAFQLWDTRIKILLMTFVAIILVSGQARVMALMAVLALSIGYYGIKGGQFSIRSGFSEMVLGPQGTFIGGNTDIGLAMAMVLPLMLVLARQVHQGRFVLPFDTSVLDRWGKPIGLALYGGFWLTALAIVGTHSRGAWVALAAIAPFLFWNMKGKITMIATAAVIVGGIGVTVPDRMQAQWESLVEHEEDGSAQGRIEAWNVSWNIALDRPLTGSGFGTQSLPAQLWESYYTGDNPNVKRRAVHSIYFQALGNLGFVGLALFIALLAFTLLTCWRLNRQTRHDPETHWIGEWAWAIAVGVVAYAVAGAFLSLAYFDLYFAMVAAAIILRREMHDIVDSRAGALARPKTQPSTETGGATTNTSVPPAASLMDNLPGTGNTLWPRD